MENLLLSFNVISPLLLLLVAGFVLKKLHFLNAEVTKVMNRVVALVLLPFLVFVNIYKSNCDTLFNGKILIFASVAIVAEFIISFFIVKFFVKDKRQCGVMLQGMFRSNYVIFGIPIAVSLYGSDGSSAAAILTMIVIPLYNALAVVALELFNGRKLRISYLLKKVVTNPLIIASALGILFSISGMRLPEFIFKPISDIGATATPMAFIFLGASFTFENVKKNMKQLSFTVFMRLIGFPLLMLSIAAMLGINGLWLVVLLAVFASPTAVSSFSLSQTLGGDDELAGNIVVFTSICSILTMFIWVFVLKSFMLI